MNELILIAGVIGLLLIIGIAVGVVFRIAFYAYGSARIRAKRGKLLNHKELENLSEGGYTDVIYHLEKKGYPALVEYANEPQTSFVQRTLRQTYLNEIKAMSRYVPYSARKFFQTLLEQNTIHFIVAMLRSKTSPYFKQHNLNEKVIGSKEFSREEMKSIQSMSLNDFFNKLRATPYYKIIESDVEKIKKGDLEEAEKKLYQRYFDMLKDSARGEKHLGQYVKNEIDAYNIKKALCLNNDTAFIQGGSLNESTLKKMGTASSIAEVNRALAQTKYGPYFEKCTDIKEAVKALYVFKKEYGTSLVTRETLGINQMLAYYIHKHIELKNIKIILKLVSIRLEPNEVKEAII